MVSLEVLVVSELVSVALAFVLVYIFVRAYFLARSAYLLGLPLGFLFLAFSYYFLGMSLLNEGNLVAWEFFFWLRLITQSVGYALIAFVYYFSSRVSRGAKFFVGVVLFASVVAFCLLLGVLVVLFPPFFVLPSVEVVDEFFTVVNLFFLSYIVAHLFRILKSPQGAGFGLTWTFLAFSLLWLGQYSLLVWVFDGSAIAFFVAHLVRLVSLVLLIGGFWRAGGTGGDGGETRQD